jgi:hypothetical protein
MDDLIHDAFTAGGEAIGVAEGLSCLVGNMACMWEDPNHLKDEFDCVVHDVFDAYRHVHDHIRILLDDFARLRGKKGRQFGIWTAGGRSVHEALFNLSGQLLYDVFGADAWDQEQYQKMPDGDSTKLLNKYNDRLRRRSWLQRKITMERFAEMIGGVPSDVRQDDSSSTRMGQQRQSGTVRPRRPRAPFPSCAWTIRPCLPPMTLRVETLDRATSRIALRSITQARARQDDCP